ncbi:hypothetical protein Y032_0005g2629 [Ancylostoma ceylanicum]|uniref:Uncharacterized protein n=1 Tax=Ancylostoma ceylanicum TaxID=53326 RepID=A0A016VSU7_9BILA|nr:hypothetical protein Y032_0005g2629 [Ancylostoma ceylanicum]
MRYVLLVALCVSLRYADGKMCSWDTDTFFEGYMHEAPTGLKKHIEKELSLEFVGCTWLSMDDSSSPLIIPSTSSWWLSQI